MDFNKMTKAQLIEYIEACEESLAWLRMELPDSLGEDSPSKVIETACTMIAHSKGAEERAEKKYKDLLKNNQERILTLHHMGSREAKMKDAYRKLTEGYMDTLQHGYNPQFDVRSPQVLHGIASMVQSLLSHISTTNQKMRLFLCPECGSITTLLGEGQTGQRLCEDCLKTMKWPYPLEESFTVAVGKETTKP